MKIIWAPEAERDRAVGEGVYYREGCNACCKARVYNKTLLTLNLIYGCSA